MVVAFLQVKLFHFPFPSKKYSLKGFAFEKTFSETKANYGFLFLFQ
jgi:hypothetical protein